MSPVAWTFMLLTMGGVLALNVLCIVHWIRAPRAPAAPDPAPPAEAPASEPPAP